MSQYPARIRPTSTIHCVAQGCRWQGNDAARKPGAHVPAEGEPRFAVAGTDLCNWHHARFPRILLDLADYWAPLEGSIVRKSTAATNDRVQTSGISDVSSLWNQTAATARFELDDWTHFLARTVLTERPLPEDEIRTYPRHRVYYDKDGQQHVEEWTETATTVHSHGLTGQEPVPTILAALAKWHSRWLSSYPLLGASWLDDAIQLRAQVMLAIDAPGVRRVGIRNQHCQDVYAIDGFDDVVCMGQLVGILGDEDGRPSKIVCSRNPAHTQITREQWMDHAGN